MGRYQAHYRFNRAILKVDEHCVPYGFICQHIDRHYVNYRFLRVQDCSYETLAREN